MLAEQNRQITVLQRRIESCPSNVEITQFTKRLFELYDNFNYKSEENRKYCFLFNTLVDSKKYFGQQLNYMKEINQREEELGRVRANLVTAQEENKLLTVTREKIRQQNTLHIRWTAQGSIISTSRI